MTECDHAALWERLDEPGWETACLRRVAGGWEIDARYVGSHAGRAMAAEYRLLLDAHWVTLRFDAAWGLGPGRRERTLDRMGVRWRVDGRPRPDLDGCIDVDVRWTPLTNTLPIRRLGLQPGQHRELRVAWISEADLDVRPVAQRYVRLGERNWRFKSLDTGFVADLEVDEDGFVVDYPGLFRRLA